MMDFAELPASNRFYSDKSSVLYNGDARAILSELPANSVDMAMTSPPFYGLRQYHTEPLIWDGDPNCQHEWTSSRLLANNRNGLSTGTTSKKANDPAIKSGNICPKCGAFKGSLGLEPHPDLYISHLCDIFDQVKRVLKKTGTIWVNLDDSSSGSGKGGNPSGSKWKGFVGTDEKEQDMKLATFTDVPAKSLIGIPERFVLEMIKRGWIFRNRIVWWKPSCMPESAKDRFTIDFEFLFLFSQNRHYFFEQQFEPQSDNPETINRYKSTPRTTYSEADEGVNGLWEHKKFNLSLGRNKRSVWSINPVDPWKHRVKAKHFASYPPELCRTPIEAGCPLYICSKCGKPRKKLYKATPSPHRDSWSAYQDFMDTGEQHHKDMSEGYSVKFLGYSDCGCSAPFEPGIVLDPFCGTGVTMSVAKSLGVRSIGIELSEAYSKIAAKRLEATQAPLEMRL